MHCPPCLLVVLLAILAVLYPESHSMPHKAKLVDINKEKADWRWRTIVAIQHMNQNVKDQNRLFQQDCTGTIIGDDAVLTAASCFLRKDSDTGKLVYLGNKTYMIKAGLRPTKVVTAKVVGVFAENFHDNKHDALKYHDLAILKVQPGFGIRLTNGLLGSVTLPRIGSTEPAGGWAKCTVAGWGADMNDADAMTENKFQLAYGELRKANVEYMTRDTCNSPKFYDNTMPTDTFCAGNKKKNEDGEEVYESVVNACILPATIDRGAPLFCREADSKNWTQVGLASFSDECFFQEHPAVYSDIRRYRTFIENTLKSDEFKNCRENACQNKQTANSWILEQAMAFFGKTRAERVPPSNKEIRQKLQEMERA